MRNTLFFTIFLPICLFHYLPANAQGGWKLGITSTSTNGLFDEYQFTSDKSGNLFVAGLFEGDSIKFGPSIIYSSGYDNQYQQLVIVKTDSSGNYQWAVGTSGPANSFVDLCGMEPDDSGNLYIHGGYNGSSCTIDTFILVNHSLQIMDFIMKLSPSGNVLWAKNIGIAFGNGLGVDGAGNVYISGSFKYSTIWFGAITLYNTDFTGATADIFIAKFDRFGTPIWG